MPGSRAQAEPAKKEAARDVAVDVLRRKGGGPIKVGDLAKLVVESGRTKLTGKTPEATVSAHIYTAAAKGLHFRKTGRGEVELLPDAAADGKAPKATGPKQSAGKAKKGAAPKKSGGRKGSGRPVPTDDVAAGDQQARGEELPDPTPAGGERPSEAAMRLADEEAAAAEAEPVAVE